MEADDVVIEYLRGKLKQARGARAESIMKPAAPVAPAEDGELGEDEAAELDGLLAESPDEMGEPCAKCGEPPETCQCSRE